ncbi:MAG: hypothetical protein HYV93_05285 [Candidatus Rokubacteria bacterium]|nr:hypothetical protein [Candidatus Rokubacteria bacterium]
MSRWRRRPARGADWAAVALALALGPVSMPGPAPAESWTLGGDARAYGFLRADDPEGGRRDAELVIGRLKLDGTLPERLGVEAHGVFSLLSPAATPAARIAPAGTTRRFLGLQHTFPSGDDASMTLEADRLNVRWERGGLRLVAGRQAITWGVNVFWPALDLFAPFGPERIDREYKPGVDAVRGTLALGELSQIEVVGAALGSSLARDGSAGALARVNLGPADVGLMVGRFHADTVAGGFVTANVRGTGLRGEVAFTDSGDAGDAEIGRRRFWRAGLGLDRQLTTTVSVTGELAWNGFGATRPGDYPSIAGADRVRRGELNGLGRSYFGGAVSWQAHPLLTLTGTGLVNLGDGSALLLPQADWSLSDSVGLVVGGAFGIGRGPRGVSRPESEYGGAPQLLYAALKVYF